MPNSTTVSASIFSDGDKALDNTQGAFLELPDGPFYGKWGILLQSSQERKANGFPSPLNELVKAGRSSEVLEITSFGWYRCATACGRGSWYFRREPGSEDSVYSVESIICFDTGICTLQFSYYGADVDVSLESSKVADASKNIEQAKALLNSFSITGQ